MTDRKKPGVAFWATLMASLFALCLVSYGPALVLAHREIVRHDDIWLAYRPVVIATYDGPGCVSDSIMAYGDVWAGTGATAKVQFIEWRYRL